MFGSSDPKPCLKIGKELVDSFLVGLDYGFRMRIKLLFRLGFFAFQRFLILHFTYVLIYSFRAIRL